MIDIESAKSKDISIDLNEFLYSVYWSIGTIMSFFLYYSGIIAFYKFCIKKILKRHRHFILTYHRITDDNMNKQISVPLKRFKKQLEYLASNYDILSLEELIESAYNNNLSLRDRISITFDDGFKNNYKVTLDLLKDYGICTTIFIVTNWIGNRDDILSSNEIRHMNTLGVNFGSHSASHPILTKIDIELATKEIIDSKAQLENILGEKVEFFAYPKGKRRHFNGRIMNIVKGAGYSAAFTTENGELSKEQNLYALRRIGIRDCPIFVFKARVSGIFESCIIRRIRKALRMS